MKMTFTSDLKDKVAVVTGGGGVLGAEFAKSLAKAGAKVAILNRTKRKGDIVVDEIVSAGGTAISIQTDVVDIDSVKKAKDEVFSKYGKCDILLNTAGGNHPDATATAEFIRNGELGLDGNTTFFDMKIEGVNHVFDLNYLGTVIPTQVFAKSMVENQSGTIINISSMAAIIPITRVPAYSGAKAAISNFTQWLAVHLAQSGVRVNAIAPGFFLTKQNEGLLTNEGGSFTSRGEKIIKGTPMSRLGKPEELVGTLLWLADESASGFVTGTIIPVDGGYSAYSGV